MTATQPLPASARAAPLLAAPLQLLLAAAAVAAFYWTGLRLLGVLLRDAPFGALPVAGLELIHLGALGLAMLPILLRPRS